MIEHTRYDEQAMMDDMAADGLPSGTVTFLLTDVEGSTRLWESAPVVAAEVIPRHRELIGDAIERWSGGRPLEQGEGDNVVAAFARATDAVHAAHAAQVALATEAWPEGGAVCVRMALHTGEVEVKPDGTYAGTVLNRCARLRALAHGGQVLVSGATADLVSDHLEPDLRLLDLGAHRLRDLSRPERVWQLAGEGLELGHPPLQSLDALPNNLPVQLSSFIGREDDIAQGVRLLGEARLLTLTGAGGCGKTRLAQRVAGELVDRFPGGTWWIELAPLADGDLIADRVAAAMGLRVQGDRPVVDVVVEQLATFASLLVLDNCEHLVGAVASFADHVLRTCEQASILATSREPLALEGEVTWRVPSLGVPPVADVGFATLEQFDAVRLFIDRAVQVRPNFRVDNENAPAVAQICQRLDGIPLAIELAAARTRSLPPDRIAAELDDRFRLLSGGSRVALPRQQTLYASVDWSHELLDPSERALLRRLAVFAGGFALDACEEVSEGPPLERYDVLDVLDRLVDKSLVQLDDDAHDGALRYRLLETIREYALDRLEEAGETTTVKDRHLSWVTRFLAVHEGGVTNAHSDALDALEAEHANIRAAVDWALAARPEDALRLVGSLGMYWAGRGHYVEGTNLAQQALAARVGDLGLTARARWALAYVTFYGALVGATEAAEQALEEARSASDDATAARCLHTLGSATFPADPEAARDLLAESARLAQAVGDRWCEADATQMTAYAYLVQGLMHEAEPFLESSARMARQARNEFQEAWHQLGLGVVAAYTGDIEAARALVAEGAAIGRRIGDPAVESYCVTSWAHVLAELGRLDEAGDAIRVLASAGRDWGLFAAGRIAVTQARARGDDDPAGAADELAAIADEFMSMGAISEAVQTLQGAVFVALDAGDVETAGSLASRLHAHPEFVLGHALASLATAEIEGRAGSDRAEQHAHDGLVLLEQHDLVLYLPRALSVVGRVALHAGSAAEATRILAASDALAQRISLRWSRMEESRRAADLATLRDALGDDFEQVWTEGGALDAAEAVAYARRARGERKRPAFGWASLTPTEEQVVALVAEGLTNPQIADRLFMGRETVKTHLGHVFQKLAVSSRAELARRATERRADQGG